MKKTKWFVLTSLLVCVALLFSSCGNSDNAFEEVFDMEKFVYEDDIATLSGADVLATYTGWEAEYVADGLLALTKSDSTVVYNAETATQILQLADTATLSIEEIDGRSFANVPSVFWVVTEELVEEKLVSKTVLYNAKGETVATASRATAPTFRLDLILFDNVCYRIADDGTIAKAFDYASISAWPEVDQYNGTYYYDIDGNRVSIYDKTLKLLGAYTAPSYADATFVILADGNVLVQYVVEQPEDSSDYTYLTDNNEKVLLTSLLYDVEEGETQALDLSYVAEYGMSKNIKYTVGDDDFSFYQEDIETIVMAMDIVDERIDTSETAVKIYAIDESGAIEATMNVFGKVSGMDIPMAIANNRYVVSNALDQKELYDQDGNLLGDVTNAEFYESYMVADGKIYDYNLKMLCDYEYEEMDLVRFYDNCALFTKDSETYLFANGAMTKLIAEPEEGKLQTKVLMDFTRYFVIMDTTNIEAISYTYYNDAGASFATIGQLLNEVVIECDGCLIVSGINTDLEKVYYRFK